MGEAELVVDRAAMIEAASKAFLQQMRREHPSSKVSASSALEAEALALGGEHTSEGSQGRTRSAERRNAPSSAEFRAGLNFTPSATALRSPEPLRYDTTLDSDSEGLFDGQGQEQSFDFVHPALESPSPHLEFEELKRPLSRKKDPSASAAAGLGNFGGLTRVSDAFEQRKTRQPIPVESWGPRPPSRAGSDAARKAAPLAVGLDDIDGKNRGRAEAPAPLAGTCTWAAARPEARGSGSDARRGRERKVQARGAQELNYGAAVADLGIFGCGSRPSSVATQQQQLSKSSSVADGLGLPGRTTPLRETRADSRARQGGPNHAAGGPNHRGAWAADASAGALEVSGHSLADAAALASPWGDPTSLAAMSTALPTRKGRNSGHEAVAVEDVETEADLALHGSYRREATPSQVIVTRSSQLGLLGRGRSSDLRRGGELARHSVGRDRGQQGKPFDTSLDVDFLSLFAS